MKLFVSYCGDEVERLQNQASLNNKPEEVGRLGQSIDRGDRIWASWAEAHGGKALSANGGHGQLEIEADYLSELPGIREQFEGATDSTCSVGVGTRLSEADRSLEAAEVQGGNRIQLYTEEVEEILAKVKGDGLKKAAPAMNPGETGGFSGASRSTPAAPQKMAEGSEHSENETLNSLIANTPPPPDVPKPQAADYEQLFHQLAGQQKDEPAQKPAGVVDGARAQVVKILQDVRGHAQELEQMQASNPELYQSVVGLVQAMIAMARSSFGDEGQQPQQVQKSEDEELVKAAPVPGSLQTPPRTLRGRNPRFYTEQHEGGLQDTVVRAPEQQPNAATALKQAPSSRLTGEKTDPGGFRTLTFDYSDHHSANTHHLGPITVREIRVNGPRYGLEVKVGPHDYSTNIDPGKGSVPGHERLSEGIPPEALQVLKVVAQKHMKEKGYEAGPDFKPDPAPLKQSEDKIEPDPSKPFPEGDKLNKDLMPGGKGDNKADSDFDPDQLSAGMRVEMEEHGLDEARAKEVAKDHLSEDPKYYSMEKSLLKGDVIDLNPPAPTGKKFRAKAKVEDARGDFYRRRLESDASRSPTKEPAIRGVGRGSNIYDYSNHLTPEQQQAGYSLYVHSPLGGAPDSAGITAHVLHQSQPIHSAWTLPRFQGGVGHFSVRPHPGAEKHGTVGLFSQAIKNALEEHAPIEQARVAQQKLAEADAEPEDAYEDAAARGVAETERAEAGAKYRLGDRVRHVDPAKPWLGVVGRSMYRGDNGGQGPGHYYEVDYQGHPEGQYTDYVHQDQLRPHLSVAKDELEKAALTAGKTGRHNVILPVGSQIDSGPSANHEAGEIKIADPATGKSRWREVRAGIVMAPDGSPTSSRNPSGS